MKRMIVMALLAALVAAGGCRHDGHRGRHGEHEMAATHERIAFSQLPQPVQAGFHREFPNAKVEKVEKETYANGIMHYEIEFVTADGKKMEVEFDEDGELLDEH
jgi:hypothetical protein